jgi:hypothetical protein
MARKILRQVDAFSGTSVIADNAQVRRRMPLGTTVSKYYCRFTGTVTTAGANASAVNEDNPYGYLRAIDTVLNSSFPLRGGVDGRGYFFLNRIQYGTPPASAGVLVATGAYAIVAEFSIDFGQPDLAAPLDAAFWLDTRLLSSLELVWTFGLGNGAAGVNNDFVQAAGATTTALTVPAITVYAEEVADAGGFLSRMQITRMVQAITVTGFNDIQLPALGPSYRAIAAHFTSGSITPVFDQTSDDTILTDSSLIADNVVRHMDAVPYRSIRQDNKTLYSVETMPAGWQFADFARSHNLRDLIYTSRTRQLIHRLNVGSAPSGANVQLYPMNALLVVRNPNAPQRVQPVAGAGGRTR